MKNLLLLLTLLSSTSFAAEAIKNEQDFQDKIFNGKGVVVLEVIQDNCPGCEQEAAIVADAEKDYASQGVKFYTLNCTGSADEGAVCQKLQVPSTPVFAFLKDGYLLGTTEGLSYEDLGQFIERAMEMKIKAEDDDSTSGTVEN